MSEHQRPFYRQYSLRSLLLLTVAAAVVMGVATTYRWNPLPFVLCALIALRFWIIRLARRPRIAVGLFLVSVSLPIAACWGELGKPLSVQEFAVAAGLYFAVPLGSLTYDLRYQGERDTDWYAARLLIDLFVLVPLWCTMMVFALVCVAAA